MTIQDFFKYVLSFILTVVILIIMVVLYFKVQSAYDSFSNKKNQVAVEQPIKNNKIIKSTHKASVPL